MQLFCLVFQFCTRKSEGFAEPLFLEYASSCVTLGKASPCIYWASPSDLHSANPGFPIVCYIEGLASSRQNALGNYALVCCISRWRLML
jgi:hypothetical protein